MPSFGPTILTYVKPNNHHYTVLSLNCTSNFNNHHLPLGRLMIASIKCTPNILLYNELKSILSKAVTLVTL